MEPRSFLLTMDSNLQDVMLASCMLRTLMDRLEVQQNEAEMVELCLMEAMVNTVRHAYRDESGHEVRLRFHLGESSITFEVEDDGPHASKITLQDAIERATVFDPDDPDSLSEGGRGMLIISQVMDEWDYLEHDGINVLRMRKEFRPEGM